MHLLSPTVCNKSRSQYKLKCYNYVTYTKLIVGVPGVLREVLVRRKLLSFPFWNAWISRKLANGLSAALWSLWERLRRTRAEYVLSRHC